MQPGCIGGQIREDGALGRHREGEAYTAHGSRAHGGRGDLGGDMGATADN